MKRVKQIIAASKDGIDLGTWKQGPVPKPTFPLSKSGKSSPRFGPGYRYRLIKFQIGQASYRVLIAVNFQKYDYYAYLGQVAGSNEMKMLASLEFHATHSGWHVHAGCGDISSIPVGRYKGDWKRNIPKDYSSCRRNDWAVGDEDLALSKACTFFGIDNPKGDPAQGNLDL